jgi:hypothetical protein
MVPRFVVGVRLDLYIHVEQALLLKLSPLGKRLVSHLRISLTALSDKKIRPLTESLVRMPFGLAAIRHG